VLRAGNETPRCRLLTVPLLYAPLPPHAILRTACAAGVGEVVGGFVVGTPVKEVEPPTTIRFQPHQ